MYSAYDTTHNQTSLETLGYGNNLNNRSICVVFGDAMLNRQHCVLTITPQKISHVVILVVYHIFINWGVFIEDSLDDIVIYLLISFTNNSLAVCENSKTLQTK